MTKQPVRGKFELKRDAFYSVDEICNAFDASPNTVRKWERDGLRVIRKGQRKSQIYGNDMFEYLLKED